MNKDYVSKLNEKLQTENEPESACISGSFEYNLREDEQSSDTNNKEIISSENDLEIVPKKRLQVFDLKNQTADESAVDDEASKTKNVIDVGDGDCVKSKIKTQDYDSRGSNSRDLRVNGELHLGSDELDKHTGIVELPVAGNPNDHIAVYDDNSESSIDGSDGSKNGSYMHYFAGTVLTRGLEELKVDTFNIMKLSTSKNDQHIEKLDTSNLFQREEPTKQPMKQREPSAYPNHQTCESGEWNIHQTKAENIPKINLIENQSAQRFQADESSIALIKHTNKPSKSVIHQSKKSSASLMNQVYEPSISPITQTEELSTPQVNEIVETVDFSSFKQFEETDATPCENQIFRISDFGKHLNNNEDILASGSQQTLDEDEEIPLHSGTKVTITKRTLRKIYIPNAAVYTSRLSEVIFGKNTLESIALSDAENKLALLDIEKLRAIISHVVQVFSARGLAINEEFVLHFLDHKIENLGVNLKAAASHSY